MGIEKPRPMPNAKKPDPPAAPPPITSNINNKTDIHYLSDDKEVVVFTAFAASKNLTGDHSKISIKNKDKMVDVSPIFLSGTVEEVRTLLHVRIDEWMDTYYDSIKNKKGPLTWTPNPK